MGASFLSKSWRPPVLVHLVMIILCCSASKSRVECQAVGPAAGTPPLPSPLVPALFIFGDSLVDVGNNNYIGSLARANYYPNGVDFPGGIATGRFCNGKTVLDFISEYVGLPYPPPFLHPTTNGQNLFQGVNYASGAGGILDSTGSLYIQRIGMNQQIRNFQGTVLQLYLLKGVAGARSLLSEALYTVVVGANDYINNYLQATNSPTYTLYSPKAYQQYLLATLSAQLMAMYNLGARKVVVTNVGPLGCIPEQISMATADVLGRCIPSVNQLVVNFNDGLRSLLSTLNSQLPSARFVYADVYTAVLALVSTTPQPQVNSTAGLNFTVGNVGCCGLGRFNGQFPCLPSSNICGARINYVFWDPFHPTEAANRVLADLLWSGGPNATYPVNVQQLVAE